MTLEHEIRSWLRRYLRNEIPFETFEDWLVEATLDVHRKGSGTEQWLTSAIERHIGEFTSRAKTEAQLKRALRVYAPTWWATPPVRVRTSRVHYSRSDAQQSSTRPTGATQWSPAEADTSHEVVPG
jgi:hypothetical protein